VFAAGLAGYEPLQEGLGLFAEYLAGGLDQGRLRVIAARVLAVRRLLEGASFPAVVAEMTHRHGLPLRAAFDLAIRVFRGGGLTKDAIYLRGLLQLLAYLAGGGALEPLLVGKIAIEQVPLVEELVRRQILVPARLRPRWLDAVALEPGWRARAPGCARSISSNRSQRGAPDEARTGLQRLRDRGGGLHDHSPRPESGRDGTRSLADRSRRLRIRSLTTPCGRWRAPPRDVLRFDRGLPRRRPGERARVERITVDDLDVLFLRNDPAADLERPWAQSAGFVFGQRAADRGVVVVNDPYCLANAINKMYFQHFPKEVRPRALISRSVEDIRKFVEEQGGSGRRSSRCRARVAPTCSWCSRAKWATSIR
jgi:hypothetical protein